MNVAHSCETKRFVVVKSAIMCQFWNFGHSARGRGERLTCLLFLHLHVRQAVFLLVQQPGYFLDQLYQFLRGLLHRRLCTEILPTFSILAWHGTYRV